MALSRAGRQPRLNFLPYVFSLSSFVLVLFILLGGSTSTLVDLFYLKVSLILSPQKRSLTNGLP